NTLSLSTIDSPSARVPVADTLSAETVTTVTQQLTRRSVRSRHVLPIGVVCDRRDLVRRPLRAMGAEQLAGHRARLHAGRDRLARAADRAAAPLRALAVRAVLPRRGLGRRQPLALHRRGTARGAEVLPHHPAGRRGAPRDLLQALHARG